GRFRTSERQAVPLSLSHASLHLGTAESPERQLRVTRERKDMCDAAALSMNPLSREIGMNLETSDVGVFAGSVGEVYKTSTHGLFCHQWRAPVGKRERHPPRRAEALTDFHDRHTRGYSPLVVSEGEHEGWVVVAF